MTAQGNIRGVAGPGPAIAIMQGRLSAPVNGHLQAFPASTWASEFQRAADAGVNAIEWIFDATNNPILSVPIVVDIRRLVQETAVGVQSICADYFMDAPLHRGADAEVEERVGVMRSLIDHAAELGVRHIVIPCVDQSAIQGESDRDRLAEALSALIGFADARAVELHRETSLDPANFASLLARLPAAVKANYDSGNSAALGYDVRAELDAYGERVGSVHIKDRVRGGGSVPLGTGDANFAALFDALERTRYRGLFTLQVARSDPGEEVKLARKNRDFVLRHLDAASRRS